MDLAFAPRTTPAPGPRERRRRRRNAVLVTSAVVATAAAGSVGVKVDTAWFRGLDKPAWYPPAVTFPVVWTALYTGIAWSSTRALNRAPARRRRALAGTLATNLALNAG
jgi:tryptophan-rich sensory protein